MNVKSIAPAQAGTILFVDDEPLSLKYFKASVGKYAKVMTADTTEAALKILETEGDAISVVVSDERMPRESGVAFLSNVRKSWPSTVRILTSAYANIDLQEAINGAAIHRFLPKPWDIDELCSAMQDALNAEHISNDTPAAASAHDERADAQSASLELLAVLARELTQPLASLEAEAQALSTLTGLHPTAHTSAKSSPTAIWTAQHRENRIAGAACQMQRNIDYCKALAEPIAALSESLANLASTKSCSMAETASETLDRMARRCNAKRIKMDARCDFQYRVPKPVVMFVLSNLLQSAMSCVEGRDAVIAITLVPGADGNDVRIAIPKAEGDGKALRDLARVNRSALWAFGGELLFSSDNVQGTETASIRLPTTQSDAALPRH
jgi:two-component system probable response regulator PhcQ